MGEIPMVEKLWFIIPELVLFAGAVMAALMGLSSRRVLRALTPAAVCVFLAAAFIVTHFIYADEERIAEAGVLLPVLGRYVKMIPSTPAITTAQVRTSEATRE